MNDGIKNEIWTIITITTIIIYLKNIATQYIIIK